MYDKIHYKKKKITKIDKPLAWLFKKKIEEDLNQ